MPSLARSRSAVKSKLKAKISKVNSKLKSVAKAVAAKANGKNGHTGIKVSAQTAILKKAGKRIYFFGGGKADGTKEMKNLLGGKGANLAEMANIGLPVPPGFTITTDVCTEFYTAGKKLPKGLDAD